MTQSSELTSPREIEKRATERRGSHSGRLAAYHRALKSVLGDIDPETGMIGNQADGRPALRLPGAKADNYASRGAPNYHRIIVDDIVALRGIMPKSAVLPQSSDEEHMKLAVKLTRALREQHEHSAMDSQQPSAAFFLSALGDVCYVLDARTPKQAKELSDPFRPAGIYWTVVNPENAFPKFSFGNNNRQLEDLFLMWTLTKEEIKDAYGIEIGEEDTGNVIHYYSRTEKQIVVAGRRIAGIKHNLGFCPAEWVTNGITDGRFAQSDVIQSYLLHEELQDIWKVTVDSLVWSVFPIIHVQNRDQVASDQIEYGPGAMVETWGQGNVNLLSPQANPQAAKLIFDLAADNIMKQAGVAPVRLEGQIDRSNVSGRSVGAQQAPMEQRITVKNVILGEAFERLNAKTLRMLYEIPELNSAEMELYGQDAEGETYNDTFTGEDVGGWVRNSVKFDPLLAQNRHERTVIALQLYKEGHGQYPWRRVLEESGEDDPRAIMDEGKAEAQAAQQPQAAGAMGPGGPQPGGNPQQAAVDAMQLAGGGSPQGPQGPAGGATPPAQPQAPPTPPMPPFNPVDAAPTQPGMGSPAAVPDINGLVQSALAGKPLHEDPQQILALPSQAGLRVVVADHRDVAIVKQALAPVAAQLVPGGKVDVKIRTKGK